MGLKPDSTVAQVIKAAEAGQRRLMPVPDHEEA
jgi:hypothetical protein